MKATKSKNQKAAQKQAPKSTPKVEKAVPSILITELNIHRAYSGICENVPSPERLQMTEKRTQEVSITTESKLTGRVYISGKNQNINFNLTDEDLAQIENIVRESVKRISSSL